MLKMLLVPLVAFFLTMAHTAAAADKAASGAVGGPVEAVPELSEDEVKHIEELREKGKEEMKKIRKQQKQRSRELRGKRRPPGRRR